MVAIVSIGIGNVNSVKNMLERIGCSVQLLTKPPKDEVFNTVIIPGVGSFDNGMKRLQEFGWQSWLRENEAFIEGRQRLIGICLGMQLLTSGSEEGLLEGLGLIPGICKKFAFPGDDLSHKVPHMGWKPVAFNKAETSWLDKVPDDSRYYFVHSYYYPKENRDFILGTASHGLSFAAAIRRGGVVGFQFHPEKSHRYGKVLLKEAVL